MSDIKDIPSQIVKELGECLGKVSGEQMAAAAKAIEAAPRIFLAGAGRSLLGIRGFAMRLMHMGMQAYVVGETTTPGIAAGDLLIVGSGSGRTASLVATAQKAKQIGASILLVTIDPTSPIGEVANVVVQIPAPSPKAIGGGGAARTIQPMGSLFEQSLFLLLDAMVVALMKRSGMTTDEMFKRHANLE